MENVYTNEHEQLIATTTDEMQSIRDSRTQLRQVKTELKWIKVASATSKLML